MGDADDHVPATAAATPRPAASTVDALDEIPADQDLPVIDRDRYQVGDEISRGGIGRVMRGRDRHLDRIVAIKQLLAHNSRFEARFRREALITAKLQHPGIVPIYEAGRWPGGEPFYAMKLVSGRSLKDEIAATASLDDRLALIPRLLAVCDAVAYAHSERVIHRDLKPANLMLGSFGEAYVVDWGLAKDLATPAEAEMPVVESDGEGLTRAGSVLGTPPYLPPEQARGEAVDARADVYALGAVIYHALGGRAPYDRQTGDPMQRVIDGPPPPIAEREPEVPRELAAIVDKAMARDPADRYRDAGELAADLRRFQTGQLVSAHRYSTRLLVARWLARHRSIVGASAAAIAAIAVIGTLSVRRIVDERDTAERAQAAEKIARERAEAEATAKAKRTSELYAMQADHALDRDPTLALAWLKRHAAGTAPDAMKIRTTAIDADSRLIARDVVRGIQIVELADDGTAVGSDSGRHVAFWRTGAPPVPISAPLPRPSQVVITRDGRFIAWVDTAIELYDRTTSKTRAIAPIARPPSDMRFVGDELAIGEVTGELRLVNVATGNARTLAGHHAPITETMASPDGTLLVTAGGDSSLRLWTIATGEGRNLPADDHVVGVAFSPRGDRVAWCGGRAPVRWMDLPSGAVHPLKLPAATVALAFSPDSQRLVAGGEDATVRVFDLAGGPPIVFDKGHNDWINGVAFSPDGRTVVSAQSRGGPIFVWDLATRDRRALLGHSTTLNLLKFAPGGDLITGDRNAQVRRWHIAPSRERLLVPKTDEYPDLAVLPTGALVAMRGKSAAIWDTLDGAPRTLANSGPIASSFAPSPNGDRVAAADTAGNVWVWTVATGAATKIEHTAEGARDVAFSPDGAKLAVAEADGSVRIWTLGEHPTAHTLSAHLGPVVAVAFSPDGKKLASGGNDTTVRIWDLATGEMKVASNGGTNIDAFVYGPDGTLAVGRSAGMIELFSPDGKRRPLPGHTAGIAKLVFASPTTLVSAANDGTARIWDLATGSSRVLPHRGKVQSLVAIGDGRVATGNAVDESGDATIRVWDLATAMVASEWHGHISNVYALAVTPDRKTLISSSSDRTIRAWPLDPPVVIPPATLGWLDTLTSADLGDGDIVATPYAR